MRGFLAVIAVAILALTCFAACSDDEPSANANTDTLEEFSIYGTWELTGDQIQTIQIEISETLTVDSLLWTCLSVAQLRCFAPDEPTQFKITTQGSMFWIAGRVSGSTININGTFADKNNWNAVYENTSPIVTEDFTIRATRK